MSITKVIKRGEKMNKENKKQYVSPKVVQLPINLKELIQTSSGGGGCPYAFVWDGSRYVEENNLLPYSEDFLRKEKVLTDYYILQTEPKEKNGALNIKIKELEKEISRFEKFSLLTVEHGKGCKLGITNNGKFVTYKNPFLPDYCINEEGEDCLSLISNEDWKEPKRYFSSTPGDSLEMDFGKVESENAKLVIVDPQEKEDDDEWFKLAAKCNVMSIHVYLDTGKWEEINVMQTREKFYPDIIDLSSYLPKVEDNLKIKLEFTAKHKVAFVGLDTSSSTSLKKKSYKLKKAFHSNRGEVTEVLNSSNSQSIELFPEEEIGLKFPLSTLENPDNKLTYVLISKGYYIPVSKLFYSQKYDNLVKP